MTSQRSKNRQRIEDVLGETRRRKCDKTRPVQRRKRRNVSRLKFGSVSTVNLSCTSQNQAGSRTQSLRVVLLSLMKGLISIRQSWKQPAALCCHLVAVSHHSTTTTDAQEGQINLLRFESHSVTTRQTRSVSVSRHSGAPQWQQEGTARLWSFSLFSLQNKTF